VLTVLNVAALVASLAFLALVAAAVPMLLQLGRTARAAEQTLAAVEREVRPLATQLQALLQEHRELAQQGTRDLRQAEALVVRAHEVVARLVNLTAFLGHAGTLGHALGLVRGVGRGVDVFVSRLARRS
jgi:uncharacterized protein YoxC